MSGIKKKKKKKKAGGVAIFTRIIKVFYQSTLKMIWPIFKVPYTLMKTTSIRDYINLLSASESSATQT